jgi:hypothetical protein
MHIAAVSRVDMTVDPVRASAEFRMSTNKLHASILVTLVLAAMIGLLLPLAMIAFGAASNPQVLNSIAEHPGSAALLLTGVAIAFALLLVPLRAGLARLGGNTRVEMADGVVTVERQGLIGTERWHAPLAEFCGVTHHIRATLSGPRHEIVLLHTEPGKDVLLHLASRHPQEDADHFARLLGLAELQPRELYNRRRSAPAANRPTLDLQARAA